MTECDQLKVLQVLADNDYRFAYMIEELERYTGPPTEIKINSVKDIFRPPHKLGEKEWTVVGEQCTLKVPKRQKHQLAKCQDAKMAKG